MSFIPGVKLVEEGSGNLIGHLPSDAGGLGVNNEVVYTQVGGASVTYKIEKVVYYAEYKVVGNPEAPDSYSVYGRTELIVSVVP